MKLGFAKKKIEETVPNVKSTTFDDLLAFLTRGISIQLALILKRGFYDF